MGKRCFSWWKHLKTSTWANYTARNATNVLQVADFTSLLRYIQNRRTFLVCLTVVLCYGISHIPWSVWLMWFITDKYHLQMKYVWIGYFANVLTVAGSYSVNPLIYGILDKQLVAFWKCCCKKKRKTQESQAAVVLVGETRTAHRLHAL